MRNQVRPVFFLNGVTTTIAIKYKHNGVSVTFLMIVKRN